MPYATLTMTTPHVSNVDLTAQIAEQYTALQEMLTHNHMARSSVGLTSITAGLTLPNR